MAFAMVGAVINAQLDKNFLFHYTEIFLSSSAECIADLEVPCEVAGEVRANLHLCEIVSCG